MQMIKELFIEIYRLALLVFMVGLIYKVFLKNTLLGKMIAVILKDTWLMTKLFFRITKRTGKMVYKAGKYVNKRLSDKRKPNKQKDKKVVNGTNVIDFQSAKVLRHKWNK